MVLFVRCFQQRIQSPLPIITRSCSQKTETQESKKKSPFDEHEVNFFGDLSKDWWDENGPMKPLHALNRLRVQFIRSGLINTGSLKEQFTFRNPTYLKGMKIADVGCGGGILSLALARLGCSVVGVEPSQDLVKVAQNAVDKFKPPGETEFVTISIEDYSKTKANFFDAVICSEVIEHVTTKEDFVKACSLILKPGGSIFFTTLNRTLPSKFLSIYAAENLLRIVPVGSHQYEKFITPEELSHLLDINNCFTKMVNGFLYCPLDNTFYWMPTPAVHYALHAVKKK